MAVGHWIRNTSPHGLMPGGLLLVLVHQLLLLMVQAGRLELRQLGETTVKRRRLSAAVELFLTILTRVVVVVVVVQVQGGRRWSLAHGQLRHGPDLGLAGRDGDPLSLLLLLLGQPVLPPTSQLIWV